MAARLFNLPFRPAFDLGGRIAPGAMLRFYVSGTTTPATAYADPLATEELGSVVLADASGRFSPLWLSENVTYRVDLVDRHGALIGQIDPYQHSQDGVNELRGAFANAVNGIVNLLPTWFKGDPGGNAMSIGLFMAAAALAIPAGTDLVQTSGFSLVGRGAARYSYDPAVNAAYVAAHPRTAFISSNGRGFRLCEGFPEAQMLGVVGDGATDDTDAIHACATDPAVGYLWLGADLSIKTTSPTTIVFRDDLSVDFGSSKLVDHGPKTRIAYQFGSDTFTPNTAVYTRVYIESPGSLDLSNEGYTGARFVNMQRTSIDIHRVEGFTRAVDFLANGQGFTGVRVNASFIGDCKYALTSTVTTTEGRETYFNGNFVFVEDWTNVRLSSGDSFGWHARGLGSMPQGQNGNTVWFQTVQPGNGDEGDKRCLAFLEDCAALNTIRCDRYESGRGPVAHISGIVNNGIATLAYQPVVRANIVQLGLLSKHGAVEVEARIQETGSARHNLIEWINEKRWTGSSFTVHDVAGLVKAYTQSHVILTGPLHITDSAGEPLPFVLPGGLETGLRTIDFNGASRSIGYFIDVKGGETITLRAETDGKKGLLGVAAYDEAGARLVYNAANRLLPDVLAGDTAQYNFATGDLGGCYRSGSPTDEWTFTLSERVRRIRVFFAGDGRFRSFGHVCLTPATSPLAVHSGSNGPAHYANDNPTGGVAGRYAKGDLALNDAGNTVLFYRCTDPGYMAPAWAGGVNVPVGKLARNGGNIYAVIQAGQTAASGGPAGNGASITDGTVKWRYVGPAAAFVAAQAAVA